MFFKRNYQIRYPYGIQQISPFIIVVAVMFFLGPVRGQDETVDRILALVNDQVITLTDVRIAKAFGLYEKRQESTPEGTIEQVLRKLIDQKLVIQVTSDVASVDQEEMNSFLDKISEEMGRDKFQEELDKFGMKRIDLRPYVYERILFDRILSARFDRDVSVTLEEIKHYYDTRYVPAQRGKGLQPKSMLDVFDEIESALRREKSEADVEEWLKNLREKSDIQIN